MASLYTSLLKSMNYPLKVQGIRSKGQAVRLYVSFPQALAAAIGLEPGDEVEWELLDREELHMRLLAPRKPVGASRSKKS